MRRRGDGAVVALQLSDEGVRPRLRRVLGDIRSRVGVQLAPLGGGARESGKQLAPRKGGGNNANVNEMFELEDGNGR